MSGVWLRLLHPEVANRDCNHCQKYSYNEATGAVNEFNGQPRERYAIEKPPCRTSVGCPKGTPENSLALSPANCLCYKHYQRCAAVGRFPDDTLVAEHAVIIREVEREAWEKRQLEMLRTMLPAPPSTGN